MPDWLRNLLLAYSSVGFADSLSTLVGREPQFVRLPDSRQYASDRTADLGGQFYADKRGNPVIGLSPFTLHAYGRRGSAARPGYRAADSEQRFGDYVLGHEYGHMAASGVGNVELAQQLAEIEPNAEVDEPFADEFQNAVQFLRRHSTDTLKLNSPRSRKIMNVLLGHEPYGQHPINKARRASFEAPRP